MQTKIVFISDYLDQFQKFTRDNHTLDGSIELMSHAEANRKHIFQNYYDLFIVDLKEPWLAIPLWVREQAQHHYFFQFIFISDKAISTDLNMLLDSLIFKVVPRQDAIAKLQEISKEAATYSSQHRFTHLNGRSNLPKGPSALIGNHDSIKGITKFIDIVSKAPFAPCLIRGELGVGKVLCASLIHQKVGLPTESFVIKNCENTTTNELLGDLFGVEGEFEIYGPKRTGLLDKNTGSTLVLKNIEQLPTDVQNQLLLYLENRIFKPLGSDRVIEANTRLIGITNHNLEWFVNHHNFNSGLYYRLKAFEIVLPPLRERKEDIALLSSYYLQFYNNHFGKEIKTISIGAKQILMDYKWPGNIKELKNIIERAVIICESDQLTYKYLPEDLKTEANHEHDGDYFNNCTLKELEKLHIERVLTKTEGNKSKAAEILDISRTTLREKMRHYQIGIS